MPERLTPTQERMLTMLADGEFHSREELAECLCDELGSISNIKPHIRKLRTKLPTGYLILSVVCNGTRGEGKGYRLVRRLASPYTGMV